METSAALLTGGIHRVQVYDSHLDVCGLRKCWGCLPEQVHISPEERSRTRGGGYPTSGHGRTKGAAANQRTAESIETSRESRQLGGPARAKGPGTATDR